MPADSHLDYADRLGRVWARRYRVSPMAGRVVGYLLVCEPPWKSIDELAAALHGSRSAAAGALEDLTALGLLERRRAAGERVDRVRVVIDHARGFDPQPYREMAEYAREGLALQVDQTPESRRQLEEMASLGDFLAERLPQLLTEWQSLRKLETAP